ncbi:hypothetical protein GIB67_002940 [Kingdonia uniflora]|uniref:Uncharacterized protein n=1 Tax=Kingdonia uniflora TaxID=39325 RepID=A0A7J7M8M4_9MAGN|nr:hypothetical protein GIB67_002940 [Kingdonia uniflora]
MNEPRLNLRTTSQIIIHSTQTFISNIYTFLFLSLLLFSFRTTVETGTRIFTTYIDRDPNLKSILSRLDLAGKNLRDNENHHSRIRRRQPFLHLSRFGTLDDDFFSGDDDGVDSSLFGSNLRSPSNNSYVNLSPGLGLGSVEIGVSEIFGSGFRFRTEGFEDNGDGERNVGATTAARESDHDQRSELQILFEGFELGRSDAVALFFLLSFFTAAYCWVIIGFLVINSCIFGVVFVTVVNDYLGRYSSYFTTVWNGARLGSRRLSGFLLMRWAIRDAMTQVLGFWFFGEVEDQHSVFGLFIRLKLMPFSVMSPWVKGYDTEIAWFLFTWTLLDTFVALVFVVDCWVAIMDAGRSGREVVTEGCYLIYTMLNQVIQLKCFEAILCGAFVRWILVFIIGNTLTSMFQAVVEVYFVVVWLRFYFAVRCRDAISDGRRFGRRDLEDSLNAPR